MKPDLLYQLALTEVPYIGSVHAKILCEHFPSAKAIFNARQETLEKLEGIGTARARSIRQFREFGKAEKEIRFIERYGIRCLFIKDEEYPRRLLNCYDPPTMLFYKGAANLNAPRIVAVVGTRSHTEYGKVITEKLIKELAPAGVVVVSGLALGIDSIAHRAALKHGLPTIGVAGHGLGTIYPPQNAGLAREMIKEGGLLTEFRSNAKPDKHHFPSRNRVVAGISDATIVVESGVKGGSMITAEIAGSYNRDVFAIPGRITEPKSAGCNELIRNNKAALLDNPGQFIEAMGWGEWRKPVATPQKNMFPNVSPDEKNILETIQARGEMNIEDVYLLAGRSASSVAASLLNLELQGLLQSLPGKRYRSL